MDSFYGGRFRKLLKIEHNDQVFVFTWQWLLGIFNLYTHSNLH